MKSLDDFALRKLDQLSGDNLLRRLAPTRREAGARVTRDGRSFVSFSCNDYLDLSHHPAVKAAAKAAIETYGAGAGASRLVTGDHPLLGALEQRLARWKGTEAACVFGSGYLTNLGVVAALARPGDLVLVDAFAHACLWAGAKLSGAEVVGFRHNDAADLERKLSTGRAGAARALVLTEGVFSMDGDVAPLDRLSDLCRTHDAWLLCDDAHGLGVMAQGGGTAALFPDAHIPLQAGTLSKALGGYGGYLCASRAVIDLIKTRARTMIYTTGLPPASAAAAIAALDLIEADKDLCARPLDRARLFTRLMGMAEATSPIVPIVIGSAADALKAAHALEAQGFLVVAIRPPTVPEGTARLRLAFTAAHSEDDVARLAAAIGPAVEAAA
jgi:8-amino-7-oxononanoate synthase